MISIFHIARMTFSEALRNKIMYGVLLFLAIMLVAATALASVTMGRTELMILDLGLGGISILANLTAIVITIQSLQQEKESRTLYVLLTRLPTRWQYIIGKFFWACCRTCRSGWFNVHHTCATGCSIRFCLLAFTLSSQFGNHIGNLADHCHRHDIFPDIKFIPIHIVNPVRRCRGAFHYGYLSIWTTGDLRYPALANQNHVLYPTQP